MSGWRVRACPLRRQRVAAALAAFLFVTVADATAADSPSAALLARVNHVRADHALPALTLDERLTNAAESQAEDMAASGRLSHDGADGAPLDARLARAGYRYRFAAENIASGLPDAARTIERWMDSPAHRANILAPTVTQAGIGYVELPYGDTRAGLVAYWVLIVAQPL